MSADLMSSAMGIEALLARASWRSGSSGAFRLRLLGDQPEVEAMCSGRTRRPAPDLTEDRRRSI